RGEKKDMKNQEMIPFEKAYDIVMNSAFSTGTETISFTDSLDRILAGPVISDMNLPPFNKSSVDGFAIRKADIANDLEIIETIPAGKDPEKSVGKNQCSRIMTGAPVPEGADCIIMVEDSQILQSGKVRFTGSFTKENIAFRAEDVKKGDVVLEPGRIIRPQDIAVMASVGHTAVTVSMMPRAGVISSGSELVEPHEKPGRSQIRNTNSYQLMSQVARAGGAGKYYGIAEDDEGVTYSVVQKAISENDLVLITGGVSMGDFDFVPSVLEKAGVKILFSRVAVQPGKPTIFGLYKNGFVFGLPGNPVSSYVIFELLVRPLICKMMNYQWKPLEIRLPMKEKFSRKFAERLALIPVIITEDNMASPVEFHGSAHISALPHADGIVALPVGSKTIEKGEIVSVRQI
ncbi:MAG: molybdopterin molybdotransferase MoeA, partial [Bacteroidales bacterium]|nr:molybdopterin molybdotransferase MoeA [Bacteroidales bacterium]